MKIIFDPNIEVATEDARFLYNLQLLLSELENPSYLKALEILGLPKISSGDIEKNLLEDFESSIDNTPIIKYVGYKTVRLLKLLNIDFNYIPTNKKMVNEEPEDYCHANYFLHPDHDGLSAGLTMEKALKFLGFEADDEIIVFVITGSGFGCFSKKRNKLYEFLPRGLEVVETANCDNQKIAYSSHDFSSYDYEVRDETYLGRDYRDYKLTFISLEYFTQMGLKFKIEHRYLKNKTKITLQEVSPKQDASILFSASSTAEIDPTGLGDFMINNQDLINTILNLKSLPQCIEDAGDLVKEFHYQAPNYCNNTFNSVKRRLRTNFKLSS